MKRLGQFPCMNATVKGDEVHTLLFSEREREGGERDEA